ncbi:Macrolide export ATP-binding/permease protein MacB [Porphyromonas cangingivalis]|uniref:Putative ABC transport system permease protein n=3 Tax=Porphyromonas cangingivalis TaxID=36874 RepID=A0A1T4K1Z7_PORCN|nr:FtsX-like permease family protein [Porphyromonas cangingivalis]SJZ36434.1 putative ABC transport system permease protein [Porphyromonas cangingivalis]VEJ03365.1 Macrolide export ATP-binding/permease protein MacB [Porphyromonas cangingivalis]
MWTIALKQIWKNRKSNLWLIVELLIVSVLLWYCVDFLYVVVRKNVEPAGINTEHVYRLRLGYNPTVRVNRQDLDSVQAQWIAPFEHIVRMVGEYPGIESVAYYEGSEPFSHGVIFQGYTVDSAKVHRANIRYVSEGYDKVFKVAPLAGAFSEWERSRTPLSAVVSHELADSLFHTSDAVGRSFRDYYNPELSSLKVVGVSSSMKYDTYGVYEPMIHTPLDPRRFAYVIPIIGVRVKPEADTAGFGKQFVEDMRERLNIGPYYLFSFVSYDFRADVFDAVNGVTKYIRIISSMLIFFVFIVFLGILGTFWFTMESRRGEIGLRMALGSTRAGVHRYILMESVVLFSIAFVPAFLITANLAFWDMTFTLNDMLAYTWSRYFVTIAITGVLMLGITVIGAMIPADRASKVNPVEALQDE